MTAIERTLWQTLVELENAARAKPAGSPRPALQPLFARIDELAGQLPPQTDATLRHYLAQRSYTKARLWLEGRDEENRLGTCRHP